MDLCMGEEATRAHEPVNLTVNENIFCSVLCHARGDRFGVRPSAWKFRGPGPISLSVNIPAHSKCRLPALPTKRQKV